MLARLRCKWSFDVARCKYWCNFNANASANVECCRGFMEKMSVGIASIRMKCWRSFMAKMNCWRSFMASVWVKCWMLAQFQYQWSVDVASIQIKCWGSFMKKKSVSTTSLQKQMMMWLHSRCKCKYCFMAKMNVGMASVQGQRLAQLHGKGSWCGYVAKTLETATLKR